MVLRSPNPYITDEDAEAARRYQRWAVDDPFPTIPPALLNSADIRDYASATGFLCPFHDEADWLKPASYEVPLLGDYVYWDQDVRIAETLGVGDEFVLKPNSIAFVTLEPMIRLPAYLAIRFNLRITNVYRGLLLGTGPLVDPGFTGRLSLPLHNLTTNSYTFVGGEGLIWLEVTKLSPDPNARQREHDGQVRRGRVVPLPAYKAQMSGVSDYLRKAYPHGPISSSIPRAIGTVQEAVLEASGRAEEAQRSADKLRRWGIAGTLVIVLGVATILVAVFTLLNDVNSRIDDFPTVPAGEERRLDDLERDVRGLERVIEDLEGSIPTTAD